MSNYRTPRTLSESRFVTGYPVAHQPQRLGGVALAFLIGIALALCLVSWWAS